MHGVIFKELRNFVDARLGRARWSEVVQAARVAPRTYLFGQDYPDEEAVALMIAAASLCGETVEQFGQAFGTRIAPQLLRMYDRLVNPRWKTLDLIENTEVVIHTVVRQVRPDTNPPRLSVARLGPNELLVRYDSPRKMCYLAKGIAHGVAGRFGEALTIEEPVCMLRGDSHCELHIRTLGLGSSDGR